MTTQSRKQLYLDIMSNVTETDYISYWAEIRRIKYDSDYCTTSFEIRDWCNNDPIWHTVNNRLIATGIKIICTNPDFELADDIRKEILLASATNGNRGELDVISSDCIIQAALFGEIKYS